MLLHRLFQVGWPLPEPLLLVLASQERALRVLAEPVSLWRRWLQQMAREFLWSQPRRRPEQAARGFLPLGVKEPVAAQPVRQAISRHPQRRPCRPPLGGALAGRRVAPVAQSAGLHLSLASAVA